MRVINISIAAIRSNSRFRPDGYEADYMADVVFRDSVSITITADRYADLQKKYGEASVTPKHHLQPIPRDKWPDRVQLLARLANPGETGIGQVVTRLIATKESRLQAAAVIAEEFGAVSTILGAFKWLTGQECGCGEKADRLDLLYPLPCA